MPHQSDNDNPALPPTLLTPSFLDGTKAFYQLGAIISSFVPSHLRQAPGVANNNPPQPHSQLSQQTLASPATNNPHQNLPATTSHQPTLNAPPTMGSTKAFRQPGATNSDGSNKLSYKRSTSNVNVNKATKKPGLTIQERLQRQSMTHWRQPIDEALDLHLHGHLTLTGKSLATDSWTKWPQNYCKEMLKLVRLISAAKANKLLTAEMASTGFPGRAIGTQPALVRRVVLDVKKRIAQAQQSGGGGQGPKAGRGKSTPSKVTK